MFQGRYFRVLTAIDQAHIFNTGNFRRETDASRAMDTAGHDRFDQRTHVFFFYGALVLAITATGMTKPHSLVLQVTLATLIANRTIQRVVDQEELHHAFAPFSGHFGISEDFHIFACRQRTACGRLRRSGLHLNQAHTAIAGNRETVVIAEARDFLSGRLASLQDGRSRRYFDLDSVNL